MKIAILCLAAVILAAYMEKRSVLLTIVHSSLITLLLFFTLFTSDITFVQEGLKNMVGSTVYESFYSALSLPCFWLLSASSVLFAVEILLFTVAFVALTVNVAEVIYKAVKKPRKKSRRSIKISVAKKSFFTTDRIYLRLCKLLD